MQTTRDARTSTATEAFSLLPQDVSVLVSLLTDWYQLSGEGCPVYLYA